jgi:hypothetical protein
MSAHDPRQTYSLTRHLTATPETQRDVGQFHQGPVLDRVHWSAAVLGRWNTRLAWGLDLHGRVCGRRRRSDALAGVARSLDVGRWLMRVAGPR